MYICNNFRISSFRLGRAFLNTSSGSLCNREIIILYVGRERDRESGRLYVQILTHWIKQLCELLRTCFPKISTYKLH